MGIKGKGFFKHGMCIGRHTGTYSTWICMRQRCNNPKSNSYENYGGRGIRVCHRWNNFTNFLTDMGYRPTGMTLDRINVNKGYMPSNCRWADHKTQNKNRRPVGSLSYFSDKSLIKELKNRGIEI